MLESTDKSNKYKLNVGNLPPEKAAEVHFAFVCPLAPTHDGFTFCLPPSIFPATGTYGCSINGSIDMGEEVTQVLVLSNHPVKTDTKSFTYSTESLDLTGISTELQIGIKLKAMEAARESTNDGPQELTKPKLVIENDFSSDPSLFSAMLDFRPVFASPVPEMSSDYEVVVLADCTGAMYGKMSKQQTALKLLAHSLPTGCKFNLLAINGLSFTSQWRTSVVLDEGNLQTAIWAIEHLGVDISDNRYTGRGAASGGDPKMLAALNSVFSRRDYERNLCIFMLSALDYSDESRQLNQLVVRNSNRNMRMFCLGFGDEVDTELLNSLAFSGRGKAHFVREDESVDSALFQQLIAAFAPRVRDIKVTWNLDTAANAKLIDQAPHRVPITASGASTTVFALFEVPVDKDVEIPNIEPDKKPEVEKKDSNSTDAISAATSPSKPKLATDAKDKVEKSATREKLPRSGSSSGSNAGVVASTISSAVASKASESKTPRDKGDKADKEKGRAHKADKGDKTEKSEKSEKAPADSEVASVSSPRIPKSKSTPKVEKVVPPKTTHYNTLLAGLKMPITSVTITGLGPEDQPLKWEIPIADACFRGLSRMITATAASKVCTDYANVTKSTAAITENEAKQKAITISTKFQVISKWTSYVAVEERRGEATEGAMKKVDLHAHANANEPAIVPPVNPIGPTIHHHIPIQLPPIGNPHVLQPPINVPPPPVRITQNRPPAIAPHQPLSTITPNPVCTPLPFASEEEIARSREVAPPAPPAPSSSVSVSVSVIGGPAAPPPPAAAPGRGGAPPASATNAGQRRNIVPMKHWAAPTSGKAVHYLPNTSLSLDTHASASSGESRFASEKMKRKKDSSSSPISPRGGADGSSASGSIAKEFSSGDHLSSLGFALRVDPLDDRWTESPYDAMMQQAPANFRLAAPSKREEQKEKEKPQSQRQASPRKDNDVELAATLADDSEDDEAEWNDGPSASSSAPAAPKSSYGAQESKKRAYKNSHFSEEEMVPNKESLSYLPFAESVPTQSTTVSLTRPEKWDYAQELLKLDSATPVRNQSTDQKLRVIIGTQRADGSWTLAAVAQMLQVDAKTIEAANPIAEKKEKEKEKKKKKSKHADTESADAPDSQSKHTGEQIDATQAESSAKPAAEESKHQVSMSDLWASAVVLAHLKRSFDAERNYWTFVGLKLQALMKRCITDDAKRKSIIKDAKAFLDSLPQ